MAQQQSLKTQIYQLIKKRILDETYPEGQILTERKLADELNVSRTPVRSALQRLQKEGWIQYVPYKGLFVKRMTAATIVILRFLSISLHLLNHSIISQVGKKNDTGNKSKKSRPG